MTQTTPRPAPQVTLGWRLRMAMEHGGLKADDMARELGVHRGTITRWTHDVGAQPRAGQVDAYRHALSCLGAGSP